MSFQYSDSVSVQYGNKIKWIWNRNHNEQKLFSSAILFVSVPCLCDIPAWEHKKSELNDLIYDLNWSKQEQSSLHHVYRSWTTLSSEREKLGGTSGYTERWRKSKDDIKYSEILAWWIKWPIIDKNDEKWIWWSAPNHHRNNIWLLRGQFQCAGNSKFVGLLFGWRPSSTILRSTTQMSRHIFGRRNCQRFKLSADVFEDVSRNVRHRRHETFIVSTNHIINAKLAWTKRN